MEPMGETWYTKTLNHEVDSTIIYTFSIVVMIEWHKQSLRVNPMWYRLLAIPSLDPMRLG